ncbi:MAG: hypothetical protein ABIS06_05150 [Vicinamibacterales bacterium]
MKQIRLVLLTLVVSSLVSGPAFAQRPVTKPRRPPKDRGFLSLNTGAQAPPGSFNDSFTYTVNAEDATTEARYKLKTRVLFDGSAGVHVWRKVAGVALALSRTSGSGRADTDSRIPHPFFDDRDREVAGEAGDLTRTETAVHLQLYYLKTSGKLRVVLTAGPSWFKVEQKMITAVNVQEIYPYDTAAFRDVTTTRVEDAAVGGHAGLDVAWMLTRRLGAGVLVRYAQANIRLNAADDHRVSTDAGGFQTGAGIRIKF